MDKPLGPSVMYLAPGASPGQALRLPGRDAHLPNVDDYVVTPGTREEMINGEIVELSPAGVSHSDTQVAVGSLLVMCVRNSYQVATELLTRTSEKWNFAADVSIRKKGRDPTTGRRYLEEVIFEIRDSQRQKKLTARAEEMSRRGVRRIFSIDAKLSIPDDDSSEVKVGPMKEWSAVAQDWILLKNTASIKDRVFLHPLEVTAFLKATAATDAIVHALIANKPPVLVKHEQSIRADGYDAGKSDGYDAGKSDGLHTAIVGLCAALGISLTTKRRALLESYDIKVLSALLVTLGTERRWPDSQ